MFVVYRVSGFCPWEPGEVEELDDHNQHYVTDTPTGEWLQVARISAGAVTVHSDSWELENWHQFGEDAGLVGDALGWFDSLFLWPIEVRPDQWINGRHRALLIERAGADQVAVLDPKWQPAW